MFDKNYKKAMENEKNETTQKIIYDNVKLIVNEFKNSDNLISKKELYEKFMIERFLDAYIPNAKESIKNNQSNTITDKTVSKVNLQEELDRQEQKYEELMEFFGTTIKSKDKIKCQSLSQ